MQVCESALCGGGRACDSERHVAKHRGAIRFAGGHGAQRVPRQQSDQCSAQRARNATGFESPCCAESHSCRRQLLSFKAVRTSKPGPSSDREVPATIGSSGSTRTTQAEIGSFLLGDIPVIAARMMPLDGSMCCSTCKRHCNCGIRGEARSISPRHSPGRLSVAEARKG